MQQPLTLAKPYQTLGATPKSSRVRISLRQMPRGLQPKDVELTTKTHQRDITAETRGIIHAEGGRGLALELDEFEEVVGEFAGSEIDDLGILVTLKTLVRFRLPPSAASLLTGVTVGEFIALIRTDDSAKCIRVRRLLI
jgi:hypothetical protein